MRSAAPTRAGDAADRAPASAPRSSVSSTRSVPPSSRSSRRLYATPSDEEESSSLVTTERTTGSGVVLDPNGYIVTNAHVVEGAIRLQVELRVDQVGGSSRAKSILKRRGRIVGAQIVAVDRETDLAVLKVEEREPSDASRSAIRTC